MAFMKETFLVNRLSRVAMLCLVLLLMAAPLWRKKAAAPSDKAAAAAAPGTASQKGFSIFFGGAFGAGLVIIGAGLGIGQNRGHGRREHGTPA